MGLETPLNRSTEYAAFDSLITDLFITYYTIILTYYTMNEFMNE